MTVAVREPLAAMSSCLDSLRETLGGFDDKGIVQALRDVESLVRRTHAVMREIVAETDSWGIAVERGFRNTGQLLAGMLQLSAAEARTRVEHAAVIGTRRAITGETLAPRLPAMDRSWDPVSFRMSK